MNAAMHIAVLVQIVMRHSLNDRARLLRGGGVIKIDQRFPVHLFIEDREISADGAPVNQRLLQKIGHDQKILHSSRGHCNAQPHGGMMDSLDAAGDGANYVAMRLQTLREARWILAVLLVLTAVSWIYVPWLSWVWIALILYTFYFFRDPDRTPPADENAIVAAADGVVAEIKEMIEPEVLKEPMKRIAIFLSVFDVHTNRAPVEGKIIYRQHYVGKFLDARHPDATLLNEYLTWGFEGKKGTLVVRQITGAIARRIVGWSKVGDQIGKGERFGMIRFGSRTEVYVPMDCELNVQVGDRVQGGLTVIARFTR
jgi:phosphatidylserine decarboxylase